jgi:NADH-quinone oxidoreductase subunit H
MVTVSALCTTLFLGGWRAPWPISLWSGANSGWMGLVWFTIKVLILLFVFVWLRGTLPRLRYDQFMRFGWKVLLPLNLVWILVLAGIKVSRGQNVDTLARYSILAGIAIVILAMALFWPTRKETPVQTADIPADGRIGGAEGFPLPPLDLQVPPSPRLARLPARREPVGATVTADGADADPDKEV